MMLATAPTSLIPFTPVEMALIGLYLAALIGIGWLGYKSRRENSLQDFYLAGPGIGFLVLLLTLYATQYSGNTLIAFTGRTYRSGFFWAVSIHFMTAIVVCYLIFAPRMFDLAKRHRFITPADFIAYRYRSKAMVAVTALLMIIGIGNFLVAQLIAMGRVLQGLTDIDPNTAFIGGVAFLALVIVLYETLGGFRAVAWTDALQGGILMLGFGLLLCLVFVELGSLENATRSLLAADAAALQADPDAATKAHPPGTIHSLEWLSYILAVGIGGALYPQAIQRIYAARSKRALRRGLTVMAFMPLATTLVSLVVGIIALAELAPLASGQSDTVLPVVCRKIQESSTLGRILVAVLFAAIFAALMSTADSILLSISSMFTKDLVGTLAGHLRLDEQQLTRLGKLVSWVVIAVAVGLAIGLHLLKWDNLVTLLDRKFDLLVQLAPAFLLGIHWRGLRTGPTLAGLLTGVGLAVLIAYLGPSPKPYGIHAGLYALIFNMAIAVGGSLWMGKRRGSPEATPMSQG